MKYAVIGSGAIGCFYGAKLAKAGKEVHFLFHSDFDFVSKNGLQVNSVKGDFHLAKINAYAKTSEMPLCDIVLVCLKTTNNHLLKELLSPILHKDSCIILIQNGLGIEEKLASQFPETSIAGGLAFICCNKSGKGVVDHLDYGKIALGSYQGNSSLLKQVCADFQEAGVSAEYSDDLNLSRWKKLVWNVPFNGMTVVLKTTTDALMKHPVSRELIYELMEEVVLGANACGAKVGSEFISEMMNYTDKMRPYLPSMRMDYDHNREMEIEAIYSNTIEAAREKGVILKKIKMLEQQLRFIQFTLINGRSRK